MAHSEQRPPAEDLGLEAFAFWNPGILTLVVLAACAALAVPTLLGPEPEVEYRLYAWGAKVNDRVAEGEWWRLLSSAFLHADWEHLLLNAYALFVVGSVVEHSYGPIRFLVIFVASALTGSLLSFALTDSMSVGASGAIFGLMGAATVAIVRTGGRARGVLSRNHLVAISLWATNSLVLGFASHGTDNAAHLGGLAGGAVVAFLLPAGRLARALAALCLPVLVWTGVEILGSSTNVERFMAFDEGMAANERADWAAAERAYERALPLPEARLNLAVVRLEREDYTGALAGLEGLIASGVRGEGLALAHLNRAAVLVKMRRFVHAIGAANAALASEDLDTRQRAYFNRGMALLNLGQLASAEGDLEAAATSDPALARDAVEMLMWHGFPDEAVEVWRTVHEKDLEAALDAARTRVADTEARDPVHLVILAVAAYALEREDEALAALEVAEAFDPTYRVTWETLRSRRENPVAELLFPE